MGRQFAGEERSSKSEVRNQQTIRQQRPDVRCSRTVIKRRTIYHTRDPRRLPVSDFGLQPSFGLRISAFGFPTLLGLLLAGSLAGVAQTKHMNDSTNHLEVATLGGGCFWCTEAIYQMLPGVKSVTSGYAGGTKENPTYKEVCAGNTGHAEVIRVEQDRTSLTRALSLGAMLAAAAYAWFGRRRAMQGDTR